MNNSEIIAGLRELAEERRTWFREDGDNEEVRRDYAVLMEAAERLKTSQQKHARWKRVKWVMEEEPDGGYWVGHCSECCMPEADETRFCPNCGARMDGGDYNA